ncbi:TPA: glucose-1-phosphate cytidylyltransferase [Candidatus Sumerlaeota bacterium]|nr:glucose-1-phosphate cytidylyltransferase [Candidatus Sumerlaeota bacterium]
MKAVILCGGECSRMLGGDEPLPKPMIPIGGKPILWHIMKVYAAQGVKDFILCLGAKGWLVREFFLNYLPMTVDFTIRLGGHNRITFHGDVAESDWTVTLVDTGEKTCTGGRLRQVRKYLDGESHFHLTYGDFITDVDVPQLEDRAKQLDLVVTLSGVYRSGRFGELACDGGRITSFMEKPPQSGSGRINGGFMVVDNRRIWEYLPDTTDLFLDQDVLPRLAEEKQLGQYEHDGYWECMDTLREYQELNALWDSGKAPWKNFK